MVAGLAVDQLRGDAKPIACFADASFEHVAHAQLPGHLPDVWRSSFVLKRRIAGDYKKRTDAGQAGDNVPGNAVGKVFLVRIARQVVEWQNGD